MPDQRVLRGSHPVPLRERAGLRGDQAVMPAGGLPRLVA